LCGSRGVPPQSQRREFGGLSMIRRTLSVWTVLALVGVLSAVLIGHLWDRYSQETEAWDSVVFTSATWRAKQVLGTMHRPIGPCHMLAWSKKPQLWKSRDA
jgi:hypothetical protein